MNLEVNTVTMRVYTLTIMAYKFLQTRLKQKSGTRRVVILEIDLAVMVSGYLINYQSYSSDQIEN